MDGAREVMFIDPSVIDWKRIADSAGDAVRVVVLDAARDGLAQIAAALADERELGAIHIVSHGSTGRLGLGSAGIGADDLAQHAAALARIGASLAPGGDILVYGCDVAGGAAGALFVQRLAQATGADVAASTNLTGAAALGGDWILEAHVGAIETAALAAKAYAGTLAIVAGTPNDDWLDGTANADTMNGNGGDDLLRGSAGNDIMNGGADGVYGDTVDYSQGPAGVTVNLATGKATDNWGNTDTLTGIEHVTGSGFADTLTGNAARNWFRPGAGNDKVTGNGGDDVVMYEGFTAAVTIDLKAGTASGTQIGNDTLGGIRNAHGGRGADTIQLTDLGGYVFGLGGDDTLKGAAGNDTFHAGSGDDRIDGSVGDDWVQYGDDYSDDPNSVLTGKGVTVDLAAGTATDNWGDTDTLSGVEHVGGSRHADVITGSAVRNDIQGGEGNDTIATGDGNDVLRGGDGNDSLDGGADYDNLFGGSGNDTIDGGAGVDRVEYWDVSGNAPLSGVGVTVNLATGKATDNWGNTDTLSGVEEVAGSDHADTITGDAGRNSVEGRQGDDTITGNGGDDWLRGGDGNDKIDGGIGYDVLIGSHGNDTLTGGPDQDRVEYWDEFGPVPVSGAGVKVNLVTGIATDNWGGTDTLSGIENVTGSRYGDVITGNADNNNIDGQEGNDTIDAGAGYDWLRGGAGNDTVDGGADNDRIDYRSDFGDARLTGLGVTVDLATGTATDNWGNTDKLVGIEDVTGSRYGDTITGNAGNNTIEAQEGNDTVSAGAGNDWLRGGDGDDRLDGGADRDRVEYLWDYGDKQPTGLGVTVDLAAGTATDNWGNTDTLTSIEDATGSRFDDVLTGSAVDNILEGREGIDTLAGGAGNDRLYGGDGADKLDGGDGEDTLIGGAGNDTLNGGANRDRLDYWDEANGAPATGFGVTVDLATGKATDNWGNTDTLSGIQDVTGSRYGDVITGDADDNSLDGREGNDTISAGTGNDWLGGGDGNDNLQGGAGFDSFSGGAGNDTLDGGADRDRADYWGEGLSNNAGIKVDLAAGTATDGWGGTDTLASIEDVGGSRHGDIIAGDAAGNNLYGYDGNDTLSGGAGSDYLTGGAGDDRIDGGADRDRLNYADTFGAAAAPTAGVQVNLTTGLATDNWGNTDTLIGIENVDGSRYGDSIVGNADNNSLNGNDGNDTIVGGDGNDNLTGGNGADNLQGGNDYDSLSGGSGNDTLNGGAGTDTASYSGDFDQTVPITKLGVKVNLVTGVATDNWGHTDKLVDIENVTGSRYADLITGNAASNNLYGGEGNDIIVAGAGNDWLGGDAGNDSLQGGDGNDNLSGGAGADTLNGGAGIDNLDYGNDVGSIPTSGKGVTVNLVTNLAVDNWGNTDKLVDIEGAGGSRFADTITGNAGDNSLSGNSGNDLLIGGAGNDWLSGDGGNDTLLGGDGDDQFNGGAGADTINGGAGFNWTFYFSGYDPDNTPTTGLGVTVNLTTGIATDIWGHTDKLTGIDGVGGTDFADTIIGNANDNTIYAGGGNDILRGGGGHDLLGGDAGDDTIDGGAITDLINYTDGNAADYTNFFYSAQVGVSVNLATNRAHDANGGVDVLININEVIGSDFDDTLTGSSRAVLEIFSGGKGDDVINGGAVTDRINDTNGNRVVYLAAEQAVEVDLALGTASGGGGNDILANITQVFGSARDDVLRGSNTDLVEQFYGAKGNDLIDGRGGLDQVRYAEAAAAVNVNLATGIALDGDGGTDELVDIEGVRGSKFDDTLIGGNTDNGVAANEGLEFFSGERGNDLIDGGVGFDRADYTTSIAAVTVTLGGSADGTAADGFGGTDTLRNIEAVRGSNFGDTLTGSDTGAFEAFEGRGGNDIIDGKGGIDLVDYSTATAAVNVNLLSGVATDGQGGTDKLSNIEWIRGANNASGIDVLTGNERDNRIEGLGGVDLLNGGEGADTLIGGDGNDTYFVDNIGDVVTETSARSSGGIDRVSTTISYKLGANVENLTLNGGDIDGTGNALNNLIYAGAGRNAIDGDAGTDTLSYEFAEATSGTAGVKLTLGAAGTTTTASGISGADTVRNIENVTGSKYNDVLTGNAGANTLVGGAGNDILNGAAGKDVLTGGAGADMFVFTTALNAVTNVDTIADFATGDTFRLENAVFTRLATAGTLSSANFRAGTAALDADDFILYDKASGTLSYDADGNGAGAAVKFALVGVNTALTNADLVVI